ncbi:MAG: beta-propeller domain-containing protein [Dehalococcoidia bacterium]
MKHRTAKFIVSMLLVAVLLVTLQYVAHRPRPVGAGEIGTFSSYEELKQFLKANTKGGYAPLPGLFMGRAEMAFDSAGSSAPDYSATNIQVAGVDEADIVKTDGEYLYVVSGNRVVIIQAYPAEEARILSEIELEGMPVGIFINGDRLVVFEGGVFYYGMPAVREIYVMPYWSSRTVVRVYDVSNRQSPSLQRELSSDGNYVSSRMIGNYVYVVLSEPVYEQEGEVRLPVISFDDDEKEIPAEDIYYCDVYDHFYMYTSIIAINTQDDSEAPTVKTILLGASSNLYVSRDNIYLTFPVWGWVMWESQKTAIHRIQIDGSAINYVASGEVPGMVLNQFSMDEHDGYFRVATTTHEREPLNHVYVLDMDLEIAGRLENLAPTERIYSARFMGDRAYLVTFQKIDPLFVIDLKDPRDPQVLGELKITGYSDYLHPYDENHVIGIGKETIEAESGDFAWFQGVKISLFDVSDVNNPRLVDDYEIGDRGTESPVLWDHRAFLFDWSRNLMVLPVSVAEIDEMDIPRGVRFWARGRTVWQGAYVYHISPETGFTLRGRVTHVDEPADPEEYYYHWRSPYSVTRSLYIGDVLYTISEAKVMMHSLEDLTYLNEVELPHSTWEPKDYLIGETWPDDPGSIEPSPGEDSEGSEPPDG